jgi:hypothetical protein
MISRPRWAELSADGRFIVLRDTANPNAQTNFIHARLNRASGVLEVVPPHPGTYHIHVIAESPVGISRPKQVSITVTPNPAFYAHWQQEHFTPAEIADPLVSGPDADPDRDGYDNRLEHALAGDPLHAFSDRNPVGTFTEVEDVAYATLRFTRRAQMEGGTVSVQFTSDLQSWDRPAVLIESVSDRNGTVTETWRSVDPVADLPRVFGRVSVTTSP